ncbi:U4/U5/U6 small nuclear ribonucleoprotein prp3 [Mucor velutinosus]|uniref:U4/U5/U6 small nuclear ribonucleoprotein prp3 n=2 Tax=Mucor TaxID=4830 RepID=A0AAN7HXM0_9FUNG|nr:U4/U5/U6 small nuclear ribonucleoprotein prp3 [Mucor velutinosus]
MVAARRSSSRVSKKQRLEPSSSDEMEIDTPASSFSLSNPLHAHSIELKEDDDDDGDFQKPLPMPATRALRSSPRNKGKDKAKLEEASMHPPLPRPKLEREASVLRRRIAIIKIENPSSSGNHTASTSANSSIVSSSSATSPASLNDTEYELDGSVMADSAVPSPRLPSTLTEFDSGSQQVSDNETQDHDEVDLDLALSNILASRRHPTFGSEDTEEEEEDDEFEDEPNLSSSSSEAESTSNDEDSSDDDRPLADRSNNRRRRVNPRRRAARVPHYKKTQDKVLIQHPELEDIWENLEKIEPAKVIPIEQPAALKLPLLPFQNYGVGWMLAQEKLETFKGGILADEMGMGKTIQTIALLLSDKKKPNLVIAPTVAIMQWKEEILKHTDNALSVHVFHGSNRTKKQSDLEKYDVVLSTYAIMESAFRRQEYGVKKVGHAAIYKEKSILHKVKWHRVILDEAHNIKDRSSNTARSVFNVQGNFKWSLTGTPLQNRVGELYSLIRFMKADPFAYYYCTKCPCKEIAWRFSNKRTCDTCHHTPMSHVCWWNNEVLKPIQNNGYVNDGRLALKKLGLLLDRIMLRRTKIQCADDLGLPPRTVIVRRDYFSDEEEDVYTSLYSDVARTFTTYVEAGTVLNNYANIFELLMKMRQCADHPDLVTKKKTDNQQLVCMLCNDPPEDAIAAVCKHVFCRECCVQYCNSFDDERGESPRCPSCFAEFSVDLSQPALEVAGGPGANANYSKSSIVNRIDMDKWRSSTKIEALVEELSKLRREDKTIKSIVFSQFVNFLDLVYWRLSRAGFECIRLDGTMSPEKRAAAINHFMTKPTCTVFLISLKAGGVALNLTEASRVFICDPWWNPAMDRIHRLGQHRPIKITRLIIENSIESRIVQLQEKKTALVESTVGKNSNALDKLSVEDLRFLFVM